MADVGDADGNFRAGVHNNGSRGFYQMTVITAAFTHDQTLRGPNTSCSSLQGDRFIQNKISAHFKSLLY